MSSSSSLKDLSCFRAVKLNQLAPLCASGHHPLSVLQYLGYTLSVVMGACICNLGTCRPTCTCTCVLGTWYKSAFHTFQTKVQWLMKWLVDQINASPVYGSILSITFKINFSFCTCSISVASPASGHVGTCPWSSREFFFARLYVETKCLVWFGTMRNS